MGVIFFNSKIERQALCVLPVDMTWEKGKLSPSRPIIEGSSMWCAVLTRLGTNIEALKKTLAYIVRNRSALINSKYDRILFPDLGDEANSLVAEKLKDAGLDVVIMAKNKKQGT